MNEKELMILLADDDTDDCLLFKDALAELPVHTQLTTVYNGEQLMQLLNKDGQAPDILFLDLNMPRKNGFDCLAEIRQNGKLDELAVITISTSYQEDMVKQLYKNGAQHYIHKPNNFSELKNLIQNAITLSSKKIPARTLQENFVLSVEA
jgi:CheY-like chemotaxis protein